MLYSDLLTNQIDGSKTQSRDPKVLSELLRSFDAEIKKEKPKKPLREVNAVDKEPIPTQKN